MQHKYDRCPNCMQNLPAGDDKCPYCGFDVAGYESKSICLKPFTVLQNKYMLGRVIGVGGFGITYLGWDINLQTYIAIKEYYPESLVTRGNDKSLTLVQPNENKKEVYNKGLKRYVEEAQNLSRFYQLKGIVSVKDFFYDNGTGYIVMEYINGINLKEYLNNAGGRIPEATVLTLMKPVLESLYPIHNAGLVHRDISPDNIMVDSDGTIKLIDFGSARGQSPETDKTYTVILKHGYAPSEQYYAKGNQGPWTDIYSLCATMYKMLTGQIPPNSVERMERDEYISPSACGVLVSPRTEAVLAKGLAVKAADRYQNIGQLLGDLYGSQPITPSMPMSSGENAVQYPNALSVSQQSMRLEIQPKKNRAIRRNKLLIIGVISVIVILSIVGFKLIFSGDDEKNTTEAIGSESGEIDSGEINSGDSSVKSSTENADKTEVSNVSGDKPEDKQTASAYKFEWPTELSSDWRDYTISIENKVYQLPMPYSEFETMGWMCGNLPDTVPAGGYDYNVFHNDKMELEVAYANYGLKEAGIDECFVIGISIDPSWHEISEDIEIKLAGGIQWGVSTEADIKKAFGAPEYRYEGEDFYNDTTYVSMDYAGDEKEDGMDFEINSEGILDTISIGNSALPEGLEINVGDISATPPEINSKYVAPTGPSTERFDGIINIDGQYYKLPVPVSVFTANGWSLDTAAPEYIKGKTSESTYLEKDGNRIAVNIENYTGDAILPVNAHVTKIKVEKDYCSFDVVFPGGIKLDTDYTTFKKVYSDLGDNYSCDEYTSYTSQYGYYYPDDTFDSYSAGCISDAETGIIDTIIFRVDIYKYE